MACLAGRAVAALAGGGLASLGGARPALAHAFGARYDLPLPLEFYLIGAGAAVALSFVVMVVFFRTHLAAAGLDWDDLFELAPIRALARPGARTVVGAVSLGVFVLVVAAGLFGTGNTTKNLAPTFVWIVWWVGFAYLAALVGNPWPLVNPWSAAYAGYERLARRFGAAARSGRGLVYPSWLGAWPAVLLFGLFAWFELIAEAGKEPAALATAILAYSGVTWLGMAAFGRSVWLANGEAFSLAFSVFGRFAPLGPAMDGAEPGRPSLYLRPYAGALVATTPCRLSMTAFILTMLATVTFDGFKETPFWGTLLRGIALLPPLRPAIKALHDLGFDFDVVLETVVMALFPALFLAVFLGFSWLTRRAAGDRRTVVETAGLFVWSLVPIAIAYHLAHYLSYLMIAGQLAIPLVSDPFGFGWDLFGTAGYRTDIGVIGAKFVWYVSVGAIVVGHIVAVGVAHRVSLNVYASPRAAIRSQVPLLGLMIFYTMLSLWILSQPIVGGPNLSRITAPVGRLSLAPFEFRELCLDLAAKDEITYDFKSDRPIAFDIHYHDGLIVRYAERLRDATTHAGRYVADQSRTYCVFFMNQGLAAASLTYKVDQPR